MIYTWMADVEKLGGENIYRKYYDTVPKFRKEKADGLRFVQDKAQSIGAWVLLEKMQRYYGAAKSHVFNLSHSGRYVMCSLADSENEMVGCDVEMIKEYKERLARHFFTEQEYGRIVKEQTEEGKRELFYRYWVWKESFMKATRLGMKLGLDTFAFEPTEEGVIFTKKPEGFDGEYYVKEYKVPDRDAAAAVCSDSPDFCEEIYFFTFQ